ncbi:MAG: hypothetical protein KDA41_05520, partial [Planctomycetales bacterium]|nr:hypothetical protein [Planctomycetales bacterium]
MNASSLWRATVSFAAVVAAYWTYALLAVPWIEPAAPERAQPAAGAADAGSTLPGAMRHARLLAELYPDERAWQRQRPKIIETDQAVLLLQDYRTLEDGRMELRPCTLLFLPKAKPEDDPRHQRVVVLDAPEGAILQFDKSLDLRRAEFGKLVGGRLAGEVTIRSNESQPGADDRLFLATRNIDMDQQRIWTPHEVEFRYGQSHGRGRDLIISLLPGPQSQLGSSGPNIGGIQSLELVHLERLHLAADSPGLLSAAKSPSAAHPGADQGAADPRRPTRVEVSCKGPMLFNLQDSVVTFEDQVDVLSLPPNGPSDQLNCRLLEIHFAGGPAALAAPTS